VTTHLIINLFIVPYDHSFFFVQKKVIESKLMDIQCRNCTSRSIGILSCSRK